MIEFEGVTKVFPDGTVAVDGLSLTAPTGRITVMVGPSGCGKTSILRMVNRLIDPSAGRILIDGALNTAMRRSQLRRGIGYVIQQAGLFPHRTVVENIETVPLLNGASKRDARRVAQVLLERVGLSEVFADRYPAQLSGGQQQRVGLARALAADPPILLMDEPFSALDPVVRGDLQDDLLDLQLAAPKTIVFVTHDIDEAIKLGDQIAVLDKGGRLVQLATPETLLMNPGTDFVADFLGRDRGIRKLTFLPASELPLASVGTVQAGATGERARAIADGRAAGAGSSSSTWSATRAAGSTPRSCCRTRSSPAPSCTRSAARSTGTRACSPPWMQRSSPRPASPSASTTTATSSASSATPRSPGTCRRCGRPRPGSGPRRRRPPVVRPGAGR